MKTVNMKRFLVGSVALFGASVVHAGTYAKSPDGVAVRDANGNCVKLVMQVPGELTPGCDPMDRVILLPDADGKVGAVSVSAGGETELVDTAYGSVAVGEEGELADAASSAEEVSGRFGTLLNNQPVKASDYTVRFVTGSATELTPDSAAVIDAMIADLTDRAAPEIRVTGHTDTVGSLTVNDRLSRERAQTVVSILQAEGIATDLLEAAGRGERELAVQTADNVDEPQNRRVEISVR